MPRNLDTLSAELPDLLLDPVVVVDEFGRFVFVNTALEQVLGYTRAELIGRAMIDLVHPDDRERTLAAAGRIMQGGSHTDFENRYQRKDGRVVYLSWSARWSESDRLRIAVARDVTALKRSEAARAAVYRISEATHAAESLPALCRLIHNIIDELLPMGNFYVALLDETSGSLSYPYREDRTGSTHHSEPLRSSMALEQVIRSGQPLLTAREVRSECGGSRPDPVSASDWLGVPLLDGERVTGAVVVEARNLDPSYTADDRDLLQFVSTQIASAIARTQIQDRLRHMAHRDALTDLPNRPLFHDRFDVALKRARRESGLVGLLYLDLNDFKKVNDTWGHEVGDQVLQQIAQRLVGCVRESDTVARMGGDEFTVLLINIANPGVIEIARERLLQAMAEPFNLGGSAATLTVSIGVAVHPQDGEDAATLLRCADAGMFGMKRKFDT